MPEETKPQVNELANYSVEIDRCGKPIVQKLAELVGKDTVARYLSYLAKHETLGDPEPILQTQVGSVLCGDDIEAFCKHEVPLITFPDDGTKSKIEAASYQLRLGNRCRLGNIDKGDGGIVWLSDTDKVLHIPSHGIAIVSTYEWLNIPGCLIGRWNLRVKKVYEGLVWVGSLQVDPGYQGFLFCPIYNLSDEPRELIYKDPLFTIDFVRTTPCQNGRYKIWKMSPDDKYSTFDFERLDKKRIRSGPEASFNTMDKKLEDFEKKIEESKVSLENKTERQFQINLILIGVLFTAIGVIAGFGLGSVRWYESWIPAVLAFFALAVSGFAIVFSIKFRKPKHEKVQKSIQPTNSDKESPKAPLAPSG